MRIYSNKLLTWTEIVHVSQISRLYPGTWQNYNIYRITSVTPFTITSFAPFKYLETDYKYYCYEKLVRNNDMEFFKNINSVTREMRTGKLYNIKYPEFINRDDKIVIYSDVESNFNSNCLY
jgi:hypothetical protein